VAHLEISKRGGHIDGHKNLTTFWAANICRPFFRERPTWRPFLLTFSNSQPRAQIRPTGGGHPPFHLSFCPSKKNFPSAKGGPWHTDPPRKYAIDYNLHCLTACTANMDIQFILNVYACAAYVASYVAKSENGMSELLRNACREVKQRNLDLKQQVRHIGNRFLNNVEMSAQEAVYLLLQLPLKRCSREVVFINTSPPEERAYLLKSNIDLLAVDADISESNLIKRYTDRTS
jgi:hypothetical protein